MSVKKDYDVIIIGGSYSGLAAAMALGRALRTVLVIDSAEPCNRQTPHSHNFLTQDGKTPKEIQKLSKAQVRKYKTVNFIEGQAVNGIRTRKGFTIKLSSEETFHSRKIIFASGIRDVMPPIKGAKECWGISVLHCPYCHGYEVRNKKTGVLGNGDYAFEFSSLISNWTKDLRLFTNGKSTLNKDQTAKLKRNGIEIVEDEVEEFQHSKGYITNILFKNKNKASLKALYIRGLFEQQCLIPAALGCEFTEEGYIKVEATQKTTVEGVFACGDNSSRMRTVATAVAAGTTAGMVLNKELVAEEF